MNVLRRSPTTFEQAGRWIAELEAAGYPHETIRSYRRTARHWIDSGLKPVEWLGSLQDGTRRPATIAQRRSALRSFFRWRLANGYVKEDPMRDLLPPRKDRRVTRALTTKQVAALIAGCASIGDEHDVGDDGGNLGRMPTEVYRARLAAMVAVQVSSGLRLGEMLNIRNIELNLHSREGTVKGKGGKERTFVISRPARRLVERWLEIRNETVPGSEALGGFVFCSGQGQRVDPTVYRKQLSDAAWWADIPNVHPHLLRHTFATRVAERGVPVQKLRLMLGHSNVVTTMRYVHEEARREAWREAEDVDHGV